MAASTSRPSPTTRPAPRPASTDGSVDVVVVAPADAERAVPGRQAVGHRRPRQHRRPAPGRLRRASSPSNLANAVNQTIIAQAVEESRGLRRQVRRAERRGRSRPRSSPRRPRPSSRTSAPVRAAVLAYFGPAVLALILQHLAVTLVALSLVRERTSGVIELFRVAPVNAWEVIAGKVLAYLLIGGLIAVATVALLVGVFQIPMLGDPVALAGAIGLVLLASLGIGLVIAVVSDSERQAVQLSLLLLLASVFFSGFVLAISEFTEPVRVLAYLLPVTHGIRLMQDIMLRGGTTQTWEYAALWRSPS